MSKGIEDAADRILDPAIEVVMLILVGIPICSILLAVALASCLICVPMFVLVAPGLFLSYLRRRRAMMHPLSDRTLDVFSPPMVPDNGRP